MTACTRIMRIRGYAYQRIIMTRCTTGRTYRDARMAGIGRMRRIPGTHMTRGTVGRGRIAEGGADKGIVT